MTTTHGLRGEVKVYPTLDDPGRFSLLRKVLLVHGNRRAEEEIESVRFQNKMVLVKFKGIDNINDVVKYRGYLIYVTREEAADLKEGEYFEVDLIGLNVVTDQGESLGTLKEIIRTGANDVYGVEMEDGKEVLLPAIHSCVLDINLEEERMTVHLLPGLLDLAK